MIVLPWFPKHCHPNARSRSHWPRTRATKQARDWAIVATKAAFPNYQHDGSPVALVMTFYPPTAHGRDDDGLIAATKAYRDGIADGLRCNDSCFRVRRPIIGEPVKGGKIVVTIEREAA